MYTIFPIPCASPKLASLRSVTYFINIIYILCSKRCTTYTFIHTINILLSNRSNRCTTITLIYIIYIFLFLCSIRSTTLSIDIIIIISVAVDGFLGRPIFLAASIDACDGMEQFSGL